MRKGKMFEPAIDISVLIIFFNRPGCLAQVWEQVKKARPSRLFLYQDGAREGNEKDAVGVAKCREIVSDIDWECEVHRKYQEQNFGCDPSEYIAQKWMFSQVDRGIILEDDDVPSQSFFPFCRDLLEKYKDDDRINMICGMNNVETVDSPYSYLFSQTGSIWGWATWKRIVDEWEGDYAFLKNQYEMGQLVDYLSMCNDTPERRMKVWKRNCASGVEHYETILGVNQLINHRLNIVPTKNMINNVGNTPEGSTHSMSDLKLIPHGLRRIYTMKRYEIEFPLKHPKYMVEDLRFQRKLYRIMGKGFPMVRWWRCLEKSLLMCRYEGLSAFCQKLFSKN